MADNPFRIRSGVVNLKHATIIDDETGEEMCLVDWTKEIDAEQRAALAEMQENRDQSSELVNLPGDKPYFEQDYGLIPEPTAKQDVRCP